MPRSQSPRKRFRQKLRPMDPTQAVSYAIQGACVLPADHVASVKAGMSSNLLMFCQAIHPKDCFDAMVDALNVALQLAEAGICSDEQSVQMLQGGVQALAAVAKRRAAGGSWTLHAAERSALDDALYLHGVQLDHASHSEYDRAVRTAARKLHAFRAGAAPAGSTLIENPA